MNWPNLALTKAQQAPDQPSGWMPPWATVEQKVRSVPVHCAWTSAQSTNGGRIMITMIMPMMVSTESNGLANRFLRIQATGPRSRSGAGCGSAISVRT